jgi:hypothetical protein
VILQICAGCEQLRRTVIMPERSRNITEESTDVPNLAMHPTKFTGDILSATVVRSLQDFEYMFISFKV